MPKTRPDQYWKRQWRVVVATENSVGEGFARAIDVSELDIEFSVKKSLDPVPNSCQVTVYNLTANQASAIAKLNIYDPKAPQGKKTQVGGRTQATDQARKVVNGAGAQARAPKPGRIRVEIKAGYESIGSGTIFSGDLRQAITTIDEDRSRKTEISGEDGGRTWLSSRICESFPAGTTRYQVVTRLADALGLGLGNISQVRNRLNTVFQSGTVMDGSASKELTGLLRACRLKASIQNGGLYFVETEGPGKIVSAFLLSEDSGLIGQPKVNQNGRVIATSLINPQLNIGTYVKLKTKDSQSSNEDGYLTGAYFVESIDYRGSTFGNDWYAELTMVPVEQ